MEGSAAGSRRPAPIVDEQGDIVGALIRDRQVQRAGAVEIGDPQGDGIGAGQIPQGRHLERAVAVAQQEADVVDAAIRRGQIGKTVPVEIADNERIGGAVNGEGPRVLEGAVAIAQPGQAVIGPPREYTYIAMLPEWGAFAPGITPILAISATCILLGVLEHASMRLVIGPARADRLARRPWDAEAKLV
jgi:hypothetical protein